MVVPKDNQIGQYIRVHHQLQTTAEMWSAVLLFPLLPLVLADDFRILHRIHNPLATVPLPFAERGILSVTPSNMSLVASESLRDDLLQFAEAAQKINGTFYQLALEREGDEHEGQWSISSVKAVCPTHYFRH